MDMYTEVYCMIQKLSFSYVCAASDNERVFVCAYSYSCVYMYICAGSDDDALLEYFQHLYPGAISSAVMARDVSELEVPCFFYVFISGSFFDLYYVLRLVLFRYIF